MMKIDAVLGARMWMQCIQMGITKIVCYCVVKLTKTLMEISEVEIIKTIN